MDNIDLEVAQAALDLLKVDRYGLDEVDQKIMTTIAAKYGGGPVGLSTIAASIDEQADTIEEVYEPYLMQLGFLDRTPRGAWRPTGHSNIFRFRGGCGLQGRRIRCSIEMPRSKKPEARKPRITGGRTSLRLLRLICISR